MPKNRKIKSYGKCVFVPDVEFVKIFDDYSRGKINFLFVYCKHTKKERYFSSAVRYF